MPNGSHFLPSVTDGLVTNVGQRLKK